MKKSILKSRKLWISAIVAVLIIAIAVPVVLSFLSSDNQVSEKITIEQAQAIVDDTFDNIAKNTASGAIKILDSTKITVKEIAYGNEKNIILTCSYTALNVKDAIGTQTDKIIADVYAYLAENEKSGKKINATKINIFISKDIYGYLDSAKTVSGEVTMHIYETVDGMNLYLDDQMVNKVTGGLLDVISAIKNTNTVQYNGETIDITNKNTLRTGINDCLSLENYSTTKPITGNAISVAWEDFKDEFYRNFIEDDRWTYLLSGLGTTLAITFLAAIAGIILGFIIAIIRCTNQMTGKLKFINGICKIYLTVMRGTPVMVQLVILFFVFLLPMNVDKFAAAVICFGLNSAAYVAEIVRGGITSIDKGQIEAGRSLGFNYVQTMVHFVIPQAFKAILPSLANEFISLLKESSVAFYIGVADLTQGGLKIRSITYSNFMPLIAVALIYLVLVMILTKFVSILERRLAKSDH